MNFKIGVVAFIGAVALSASFTGCTDNKPVAGETEKTLTYWVAMEPNIATRVSSYSEVLMYRQREKDSGIKIEFIHPSLGQESAQFNLMVASRELPDMIEYSWTSYQGGPQKAIDDGVIIALNEYIDGNAPNFKKVISEGELAAVYNKGSKTDNGNYFSFPSFNSGDVRTFGGPMIRKDWLDELGLPVPETIDEWTEALTGFKEQLGASTPLTGISSHYIGNGNAFNGAFGVGKRLYLDGDTVKFGPLEEGFKDYVATMRSWYQAGLLDKDFSTNQSQIVDAKITKGNSGALIGFLGSAMGRYLKQMETEDPNYNLVCAPYPTLTKGGRNDFYLFENDVTIRYLAVSTGCDEPETAVQWIDYFYGDKGYMLVNFGVEGDTYNMVGGRPVYTDKILKNPEGLSINEALCLDCRATAPAPGLKQAPEYLEQYYEFPQQTEGFKLWAENVNGVRKTTIPEVISALPEESEEFAALNTDINTYVQEMLLKFITGDESLDNYDKFVETLKNTFRVDRYVEIEQNMYDRYLER